MKTFYLSIVSLFVTYSMFGQEIFKKSHKITAKVYYDNSGNTSISDLKAEAINFGIDYQYLGIIKNFNVQIGFHKITKATVFSLSPNYFNTFTIPCGIVYENQFFYLMTGAYYEKTYSYSPEVYPMLYTNEIKEYNFGYYVGIGIEKNINDLFSITADIRKLWNINNYDRSYSPGTNETIGFGLGIGYKI
jgi:hypothetical protein